MDYDKPTFLGGALALMEPDTLEDTVEGAISDIRQRLNLLLKIMDAPWALGPTKKWTIYRECHEKVVAIQTAVEEMENFLDEVR